MLRAAFKNFSDDGLDEIQWVMQWVSLFRKVSDSSYLFRKCICHFCKDLSETDYKVKKMPIKSNKQEKQQLESAAWEEKLNYCVGEDSGSGPLISLASEPELSLGTILISGRYTAWKTAFPRRLSNIVCELWYNEAATVRKNSFSSSECMQCMQTFVDSNLGPYAKVLPSLSVSGMPNSQFLMGEIISIDLELVY